MAAMNPDAGNNDPTIPPPAAPRSALQTPTPYVLPWLKVLLLGAVLSLAAFAAAMGVTALNFSALLTIVIIFHGIKIVYLFVYAIAAFAGHRLLSKWRVAHSLAIAILATATLYAIFVIVGKQPNSLALTLAGYKLTPGQRLISNPLFVLAVLPVLGALSFGLFAWVANKTKPTKVFLGVCIVAVLGINVMGIIYQPKTPELSLKNSQVRGQSWALLPTYLPAGVVDSGPCADELARATSYECTYSFKNYPGYLSASSQAAINAAVARDPHALPPGGYAPTEFFILTVIKDDPVFTPYKYRDNSCDVKGLAWAGIASLENQDQIIKKNPPQPQRCVKVTTPGGKTLYYDSYLNYDQSFAPVPTDFYFEQDGRIVVIRAGTNKPERDTLTSLYYLDESFQPEVYKFVDGIK